MNIEKLRKYLPPAAALAVSSVFWYMFFFGYTLCQGLVSEYFYPIYMFLYRCVHQHVPPLWNPFVMGGLPFAANPQSAVFYPLSYIFALFQFPDAMNITVILHTALAGWLMYLLARDSGADEAGSAAAAVMYMLNGWFILHFEFLSNVASYVWAPAVFIFYRRAIAGRALPNSIAAGFFLAVQLFAGHPQFVYYTAGLMLLYAAAFSPAKGAKALGWALLVFLGLSAAQLIPAFELFRLTPRGGGMDLAASTIYSVRPADMARFLLVPLWSIFVKTWEGDPHIVGFYFGLTALAAVIVSFFRGADKKQLFFGAVFVLAMLLALGKYFPLYGIFMKLVPGWRFFHFPGQALFLAAFSFSLLFGFAVSRIGRPWLKIAVAAACFIELFIFGHPPMVIVKKDFYSARTPNTEFLKANCGRDRFMPAPQVRDMPPQKAAGEFQYWLNSRDMLYPNTGSVFKLYCADGREALKLAAYSALLDRIDSPNSPLLDLLDVKYLLLPGGSKARGAMKPALQGYVNIFENTDHMQRFTLVPSAMQMKSEGMPDALAKGINPRKTVLIEPGADVKFYGKEKDVSGREFIRVDELSPNRVTLTVMNLKPGWLLASESYYPGWKAVVDGEKAEIVKADYALRAVPVAKGIHSVVMTYDPWTVKLGVLISLLSAGVCLLLFFRKVS